MRARWTRRCGIAAIVAVGAACGPPPPPTTPNWTVSRIARTGGPPTTINSIGAWTSSSWFSTLQVTTSNASPPSVSLLFFPRSGPGGSTLGTPQAITPSIDPSIVGPMGANGLVGLGGSSMIEFFRENAGVWSSAGTIPMPADRFLVAMTDRWIVFRKGVPPTSGVDGDVLVYAIDNSGPTVTAAPVTTLGPDQSWPASLREGFGIVVAIDGDLMAVSGQAQDANTLPGGRVFRAVSNAWQPVVSVGGVPGGPISLAQQGLAVDDGPSVDRVAVQIRASSTALPTVEVYADTGSGFTLEQSIARDTSEPDAYNELYFGSGIGLDGDLLAVTGRGVAVPSAEVGHADVNVGRVHLYRRGATWTREAEVGGFLNPAPPDVVSLAPAKLMVADGHVAANLFVNPDPPVGCTFPCFIFGFEAWSIDRTN